MVDPDEEDPDEEEPDEEEPDEEEPDEEEPDEEEPDEEELVLERGAGVAVRVGVGAVRGAFSVGVDLFEAAALDDGVAPAGVWAAWACAMAPPMATAPTTAAIAVVAVRRSTRRVCVSRCAGVQRCTSSSGVRRCRRLEVLPTWGTVPDADGSRP